MIKKDIQLHTRSEQKKQNNAWQDVIRNSKDIDEIFDAADSQMEYQNQQIDQERKKNAKRKRHPILRFFVLTVISLTIVTVSGTVFIKKQIKEQYPIIKVNLLEQIEELQETVSAQNDSELSEEEYYQKQLILLFTTHEIDEMITSFEDIWMLESLLNGENTDDASIIIPPDKVTRYNELISAYKNVLQKKETISN